MHAAQPTLPAEAEASGYAYEGYAGRRPDLDYTLHCLLMLPLRIIYLDVAVTGVAVGLGLIVSRRCAR